MKQKIFLFMALLCLVVGKVDAALFARLYFKANIPNVTIAFEGNNSSHDHSKDKIPSICQYTTWTATHTFKLTAPVVSGYQFMGWKECNNSNFSYTDDGNYTEKNSTCTVSIKTRLTNVSHDVAESKYYIAIYKPLTEVSLVVNSAAKYGTFIAPFDVTLPAGVTAYSVSGYKDKATGELTTNKVAEAGKTLTANTPVLLYSENGAEQKYYGVATITETPHRSGWLVGYNVTHASSLAESGYKNYILQNGTNGVKFYYAEDGVYTAGCKANRAYLSVPLSEAAAKVLSISLDETTAINHIAKDNGVAEYYTINGIKVDAPVKGMNIVKMSNGSVKKIFVK